MSEIKKRILFAIVAAPLFVYIVWLGGWYFKALMTIIALIIQWEMACMFALGNSRPNRVFMYLIGIWVMLLPYIPHSALFGLGLFLLLVLTEIVRGYDRSYNSLVNTIFCGLYAPIGVLTLILIRDKLGDDPLANFTVTLVVILMIWANDVFAFIFGKNFGKHLLAPKISPKKTWEGIYGGLFGCIIVFFVSYFSLSHYPYSIIISFPIILIVSIFGPVGDLAASKLKRLYDTKDSSNMLPGHGGFFDRFDALLLAAPAVYFYLEIIRILGLL